MFESFFLSRLAYCLVVVTMEKLKAPIPSRNTKESQLKGVRTRLYSRQGYYLGVFGGEVRGLPKEDPPVEGHIFNLIPVGLRIVCIQHQNTSQYIAMNCEGEVYATETFTSECKFKESVFENYYVVYTSTLYKQLQSGRAWNLGFSRDGIPVKGSRAKKHKAYCHFIPCPLEVHLFKEPSLNDINIVPNSRSASSGVARSRSSH